jgi:hypothetical protein
MYYVFIIFFSMIYILFVFLVLREKISFDAWQSNNGTYDEAKMDMDMLVLDTLSATIVALTMPAFLFGFLSYGYIIRKALAGLFNDQFKL